MRNMVELTAIQIHLTLKDHETQSGRKIQSCLTAALNEARYLTARDTNSGIPDPNNTYGYLGRWTGAMCYITILDQIGKCYRPKTKTKLTTLSAIEKALFYFTDLTEPEISAIYALRNAFFHDFSLFNVNSKKTKYQHSFTVTNHPTIPVVTLPKVKWDGQILNGNIDTVTYINLKTLGDLVESIYIKLLELEKAGQLSLELDGGENELLNRYTFSH